jgi:hypothetical protein
VAGVGPADELDVDGGWAVLAEADTAELLERAGRLWVDGAYRGEFEQDVLAAYGIAVEVTTPAAGQRGFVVQAKALGGRACLWLAQAGAAPGQGF